MAKKIPLITELDYCPKCGSDHGYYSKIRTVNNWHDNTAFDHEEKMNTEMMEGAYDTWESKFYYCIMCDSKIGLNPKTNPTC